MIFNVAVIPQGTSGIKNMISNHPTPAIPEDASIRKDKHMQKIKNNEFS